MQVVGCYPKETASFAAELMQLLDTHHAVLDSSLRQTLVKALILMRNRSQARAAPTVQVATYQKRGLFCGTLCFRLKQSTSMLNTVAFGLCRKVPNSVKYAVARRADVQAWM